MDVPESHAVVWLPWRGRGVGIDSQGRVVGVVRKGLGRDDLLALAKALPGLSAEAARHRERLPEDAERLPDVGGGVRAGFTHRPVPEDRDERLARLYREAAAKGAAPYADWIAERLPEGDPLHFVPPLRDWQQARIRKAVQRARAAGWLPPA